MKRYYRLKDGNLIPVIGFGNFNSFGAEEICAVRNALQCGYRYIDSAACYGNEAEVGQAWTTSGISREQLFLLSKVWPSDYSNVEAALKKTMTQLQTDYLDAYLLHWPTTNEGSRLAAYEQAMVLRDKGLFRSLGVSNFQNDQIEKLYEEFGEYPVINQLECHPAFQQQNLTDYCSKKGIQVIDYRPINRGGYTDDPQVLQMASKYGKSPAQVVLRWHIEHGRIPIPKSSNPGRIAENIDVFDFTLNEYEMSVLDALETGIRAGSDPFTYNG